MGRIKVKLTLDANVAETARTLGLNVSRLAEAAIIEALKVERSRRWREMNNDAIDQYAQEVEKEGLALSRFRSFRGAPFMSQFDVFRLRDGRLVAGLQNDLLGIDVSRIVASGWTICCFSRPHADRGRGRCGVDRGGPGNCRSSRREATRKRQIFGTAA